MNETTPKDKFNYRAFSELTGKFIRPKKRRFQVSYRRISTKQDAVKTVALALASIIAEIVFLTWLAFSLISPLSNPNVNIGYIFIALLVSIFLIESFRLVSIASFAVSALLARDPRPVRPEPGKRVAFTTAIVPSKEPFEMVRQTLLAMKRVKYDGQLDIWLLDEGNDPDIKQACEDMGVKHFSRQGVEEWNTPKGRYKAKTKHGNYNAWLISEGQVYDYVMSVDSDHIPHANFASRMLGYFRDPDVAFVVGPQVYGNDETLVARGAESQSYVFQATIQRAANAYDAAMFVGTNHAYRVKTILQIGGFQDSITEDLLTSLTIHGSRNPRTSKYWKSVYTPDVLAVGEGPSSWSDFFSQQLRWSRGADEILLKNFVPKFVKLPWRAKIHYGLIIWCYPAAAFTWIIGILVSMLYLLVGTTGVDIQDRTWLALYVDVLAGQIFLYAWLRKHNVSPHEKRGSFGAAGIFFSIFAAPIYAYALFSTLTRSKAKFVVTAKGDTISPDTWKTFTHHYLWACLVVEFLVYSQLIGYNHLSIKIWCSIALASCLAPPLIWRINAWRAGPRRLLLRRPRLFALPFRRRLIPDIPAEGVKS